MVLIPAYSLQLQLLNQGSWGPPLLSAGSLYSILSPTNSNFLCTELYYCFTPTQSNLSTVKVIPLIPSTGCYLRRCISYFDSSAGVNMQHRDITKKGLVCLVLWHINLYRVFFYHQTHFYVNSQLYFKRFSLAWVYSLIDKTVLIQLIQFSISTDFVYTKLNVNTVLH